MNPLDIQPGDKYGHWTILSTGHRGIGKTRALYSYCVCDCGTVSFIPNYKLVSGRSRSCGCCRDEKKIGKRTYAKHPHEKDSRARLYNIWWCMKGRCYYKSDQAFKNYGGRGITVCDEWKNDFTAFESWALSNGYSNDLTIDRIDNDRGYSPENCRWATYREQENNKRSNVFITFSDKTQTVTQWARELGMKPTTLFDRIRDGWSTERALTEPVAPRHRHKPAKEETQEIAEVKD